MPSPYKAADLPPGMVERYGLARRRWPGRIVVGAILTGLVAAVLWAGLSLISSGAGSRVLAWEVVDDEHVAIDFEVSRDPGSVVECALRAQDESRVDVGYAIVTIPPGEGVIRMTYPLRTLTRAFAGELLGCAPLGRLRAPPAQFPPGVVAPEQPWSP